MSEPQPAQYLDDVDTALIGNLPADDPNVAAHDGDNDHEQFVGELLDGDDDLLIF